MEHKFKVGDKVVCSALPLKPSVEPVADVDEPCCAKDKLEPDFPGMVYIPEGYEAEIAIERGTGYAFVGGIAWVKESMVLIIRKVSE